MMIHTTAAQALWLLPIAIPIAIWVAWSDMKTMLIPNKAVLALMAGFLVLGLLAFPLEAYAWRWSHFLVLILIGFIVNAAGLVGAGDAKYAAAMAPFVAAQDWMPILVIFAAVLLAAYATHRIFGRIPLVRRLTPEWKSWDLKRDFPMGLALSGTFLAYLILAATETPLPV